MNREGTLTGKENELRFAREKEKNRSNVLLRFHSQGKNRFVCRWIPCFRAISPRKRTRIRVVEGYKRILERYLCGYLFHGPPDWWFASIQSDTSKIIDERIMNDRSSVGVYVVMRNKFFNEKLFGFALQENYLPNK